MKASALVLFFGLGAGAAGQPRSHADIGYPKQNDLSVVLADFSNNTGDGPLDHVLKRALEIDLEESPYLDVLSESDSASTLQSMGIHGADAPLTESVAREMCVRTNGQVVLLGSIASVAERYLVSPRRHAGPA